MFKKVVVFTAFSLLFIASLFFFSNSTFSATVGCMDSNAFNYDPDAETDDGSCYYIQFSTPLPGETVTMWFPGIYGWSSAAVCEYSYDGVSYTARDCSNSGSDIPTPPTTGTVTLYVRSDLGSGIATSSTFIYSPDPVWSISIEDVFGGGNADVDVSANGARMLAGSNYSGQNFYVSTDSGANWTGATYPSLSPVNSIDASDDHSLIIATIRGFAFIPGSGSPEKIKKSVDYGATWTQVDNLEAKWWTDVAVSSDGQKIALASDGADSGDYITLTTDQGATWSTSTASGIRRWGAIDMSSDGSVLVGAVKGGYIYVSTNFGTSWATSTSIGTSTQPVVAVSGDGSKIIVAHYNRGVHLSSNSGSSWTTISSLGTDEWTSVSISSDGARIILTSESHIYVSSDSGASWQDQAGFSAQLLRKSSIAKNASTALVGGAKLFRAVFESNAPVISNISSTTSSTTAIITWDTDENSSSQVFYGPLTSYSATTTETDTSTRVTSHSVSISSLVPCTTYNFKVRSADVLQNVASSSNATFTTAGCTSSSPIVTATTTPAITSASGGSAELLSGNGDGIELVIPAGYTASTSANFTLTKLEPNVLIAGTGSPSGYSLVGPHAYELKALTTSTTTISSFDETLTISISYLHSQIEGWIESSLRIYSFDGSTWSLLSNCVVDPVLDVVTCETDHFTVFALFGTPVPSTLNPNTATAVSSGGGGGNSIQTGYAVPAVISAGTSTTRYIFKKDLRKGMKDAEVKELQKYLNAKGFVLAVNSFGSPGLETDYFGNITFITLKKFQAANKLPSTGFFGPMTKAVINR